MGKFLLCDNALAVAFLGIGMIVAEFVAVDAKSERIVIGIGGALAGYLSKAAVNAVQHAMQPPKE